MFTGIVQGTAPIIEVTERANFRTHVMKFTPELLVGLETGASVAHNGCCLTVTKIEGEKVSFDLIKETLRRRSLRVRELTDKVLRSLPARKDR